MKFTLFKEYRGLRKELYILFLGRIMTNLGSMIWPILTLILSQKLGMNASMVAVYLMIVSLVGVPISLIGGKLADKYNKKNIIVICDLISVAGYVVCFFIPISLTSVIIFSISALLQTAEGPSYEALVADFTKTKDRERAYSLSYLGSNLGLMLAPTLGGLLFNNYLNLAFLINGIAILSSTILIFFLIKNVNKEENDDDAEDYQKNISEKSNTLKYVFSNKVVLIFIILQAFGGFIYSMYQYLLPLEMGVIYGEQGSVLYGTMSSVNCIAVLLFTPLVTRIFKKICETKKLLIGECLIILGYVVFVIWAKLPAFCYVSIVIFTIGEVFSTIAGMPFLTKRIPSSHRGRIIAIYSVASTVVYSCLQVAVGALYDNIGSYSAWIFVAAFAVVVIALLLILIKIDKKYYRNLYYSVDVKGHTISIKTTNLPLLEEYYKEFVYDPILFINKECPVYEYSQEKVNEYYNKITSRENQRNYLILDDANPIGESHLKNIDFEKKTAELSIHLQNDKVKGKGYGTVGEILTLKRAFIELGLETVTANCMIQNKRSQHVLEKVGFKKVKEDKDFIYYEMKKADLR